MPGPIEVIDAHTHAFSPDRIAERAHLVERDFWFGELYRASTARLTTTKDLIESSAASGVSQTIVCGFPWSDEGLCREENAYLAAASAASGGRLAWSGTVVPGDSQAAVDTAWCLEHGASGMGEFNADGQRAPLHDIGRWTPIVEVLQAADRPMLIHASEGIGHQYPGKGTATPEKLVRWIAQLGEVNLVLAHWGGGLPFYELMPEIQKITSRVVYDCAASTYLYKFDIFPRVIDLVGANRVIWGSDFPVLSQKRFLDRTLAVLRSEEECQQVLAASARTMYRLPEMSFA